MLTLAVVEAHAEVDDRQLARRRVGRYALFGEIASGGMATVYFGRLAGAVGFSRSVAVKQLHPQFARSPEFVAQFLDEAQLTARIRHPNVVSVLDVVAREGELFVIMEFVEGEPLSRLARAFGHPIPISIISAILVQVLLGLHAAHEATTENGEPLQIVHRDVSPQNMLVGIDGTSHILDFGVAKAASRVHTTENGQIKGKLSYMAPEQLRGLELDRRVDVFAAGIVLWELLASQRLFARSDPGATVNAVLEGKIAPPSQFRPDLSEALDALVLKALAPEASDRFGTAREMAVALENCVPPASNIKVGAWVEAVAGDSLRKRAQRLRQSEESTGVNEILDVQGLQKRLADARASLHARDSEGRIPLRAAPADPTTEMLGNSGWAPSERRSPWHFRGTLVALGLLALGLGALILRPGQTPALASARASAPSEQLPLGNALRTAQAPGTDAAQGPVWVLPVEVPLPSASSSAPLVPTATATPAAPVRVVRKAASKIGHTSANCEPPFVLDAQGRKRFKPECF